jgi:iron complex outermembrane receptor protein
MLKLLFRMAQYLYPRSPSAAAALFCGAGVLIAAGAEADKNSYDMPGGDAAVTLEQFARISGQQIAYMVDNVRGEKTRPVRGSYAPIEALREMLTGSALLVVQDEKTGAIVVTRRRPGPVTKVGEDGKKEPEKTRGPPAAAAPLAQSRPTEIEQTLPRTVNSTSIFSRFLRLFSPSPSPSQKRGSVAATLQAIGTGLLATATAFAQPADSGSISGRIFNPTTGQYVQNASVRLTPGGLSTESGPGGYYRIGNIPAGQVQLTVVYTGYTALPATLAVAAGGNLTNDIELVPAEPGAGDGKSGDVVRLAAFTVNSDKEGNAKAIMSQRSSMNISNSVSADAFGDVPEDQVGEMLKNIPGVDVNRVGENVRNIRLRGLPAEYTSVTLDGVGLATADASGGAAGDSRALSFEQASLSSLESIEVMKTVSADVDANAPAGTINLKTKRAFDRNGRRIAWQLSAGAFSADLTAAKRLAPDEREKRRILPGASLEYSDIFMNKRLGVVLNLSASNVFNSPTFTSTTLNTAATAADPRRAVVTGIFIQDIMNVYARENATITVDMKITPDLVASVGFTHSLLNIVSPRNNVTFSTGNRASVVAADPLTGLQTTAVDASVASNSQWVEKYTRTNTYTPKLEYRWRELAVEARFALSEGRSWYDVTRRGSIASFNNPTLTGVNFEAQRAGVTSGEWFVRQTSGPDWANGAAFTSPAFNSIDGRIAVSELYSGELVGTLKTRWLLPVEWKAGVKTRKETRDFDVFTNGFRYDYTGPGAGVGAWAALQSVYSPDPNYRTDGAVIRSTSRNSVFAPSLRGAYDLFRSRPEYFTKNLTTANYYDAFVSNRKHYEESIDAGFLMATARFSKFQLRAGIRREETGTDSLEPDVVPPAEVIAAGFPVAAGRATTIPGIEYQYNSKPKVSRIGVYHNMFPSASAKYKATKNLDFQFGYSSTIRRPPIRDLAGVWTVNDTNLTVSAPNPRLLPETSDNLSARAAYYFEPVGMVAVNVFQNTVDGLFQTTRMSAQQFGYEEEDLRNYEFITTVSGVNQTVMRGVELEYSQTLSFLPKPLDGFSVRASYGRNYANRVITGAAPHRISGGVSYLKRGFRMFVNANWNDNTPVDIVNIAYLRHRLDLDVGGSLPVRRNTTLFFTIKNPLNVPYITMSRASYPASSTAYAVFGSEWNMGIRGSF